MICIPNYLARGFSAAGGIRPAHDGVQHRHAQHRELHRRTTAWVFRHVQAASHWRGSRWNRLWHRRVRYGRRVTHVRFRQDSSSEDACATSRWPAEMPRSGSMAQHARVSMDSFGIASAWSSFRCLSFATSNPGTFGLWKG